MKTFRFISMTFCLLALLASPVQAALLGYAPGNPSMSTFNGSTSYSATSDEFSVEAVPFVFANPGQVLVTASSTRGGPSLSLEIKVNEFGNLTTSTEFSVIGSVVDSGITYDGELLSGVVTQFGFAESGTTDFFDFRVSITGGELAALLNGEIGVRIQSEASSFEGGFNADFAGGAKLVLGTLPASLGDFVWEDLNANGIQDSGEPGVEGVMVNLFSDPDLDGDGDCTTGTVFVAGSTTTDMDGKYGFDNLVPGQYCVEFLTPAGYEISPQDKGMDDSKDSDVDPASARTINTTLVSGEHDPTWDAGIYRPARLGDYVWLDQNRDGIQDLGESGIAGVVVNLLDCTGNPVLEADGMTPVFTFTDANGLYLFDNLVPGGYMVEFIQPAGLVFSPKEQGTNTDLDSNADLTTGRSGCVTLQSGDEDLSIDAGLYLPALCDIGVSKSCEILQPVINTSNFSCSDAKPLDQLTMIWNGSENIDVVAYHGSVGDTVVATVTNVAPGDEVTISGFLGAGNNVEWEIFATGTSRLLGLSGFHMSCSDPDMNGPASCGLAQGDNKGNDGSLLNDWLFEGMAGSNGVALDCTSPVPPPTGGTVVTACEFESALNAGCDGRVIDLDLRYNGGDCSIMPNTQEGRASCEVGSSTMPSPVEPVRIRVSDGGSKVFLDTGVANVMLGDIVSATSANASVNEFSSNTVVEIFDGDSALLQTIEFHTSCSKPLNLGDRFGGLEVVTMNSKDGGLQSLGREVSYSYLFTNNSSEAFSGSAIDSGAGSVVDPLNLAPGESLATSLNQFVVPDASGIAGGTVVVMGQLNPSGLACEADASTTVTRIVQLPDCSVEGEDKLKISDDKIEWKLFNTGNDPLTVESISVSFPSKAGEDRGIKKVKLDGDIFKDGDVKSPALIDSFVGDLKDRQIKAGDDKRLIIEFTDKARETLPSNYEITVNFSGGCSVTLDTTSPVGNYSCNKPIDQLTMIWNGSESVSVEAFKGSVGSTSLGVHTVAPGAEISFSGFAGSPNDVYWVIKDSLGGLLGESKFHLSCSDGDMNGPEDCGKLQGNGKDNNSSLINLWQFEGIVDAGGSLNCTP